MAKSRKWKTLDSKIVLPTPWYRIRQERVQLPNGLILDDYFLSELDDVVMLVPITAKNEVILVRQYRHGAGELMIELPAGTFDPQKESAEDAAERELLEETGYKGKLTKLGVLREYPTKATHQITVFLVQDLQFVQAGLQEETEDIETLIVPFDKALAMIDSGQISVTGSIASLHLAASYLRKQPRI